MFRKINQPYPLIITLLGALSLWGCLNDDSGDSSDAPITNSTQAKAKFQVFFRALCDYQSSCGGVDIVFDNENCQEILSNIFLRDSISIGLKRLDEGVVEFNSAALSCGITAYRDATASCAQPDPNNCGELFIGSLAEGATCLIDDECALGLECTANSCISGTCVPAEPPCSSDADCVADYGEGATCIETQRNRSGFSCKSVPAELGDSCWVRDCDSGLQCDETEDGEYLCVAASSESPSSESVMPIAIGEACDIDDDIPCEGDAICTFDRTSERNGSCQTRAQLGESCTVATSSSFSSCGVGLYCRGLNLEERIFEGTCATEPREGEACAEGLSLPSAQNDGEGYCPFGMECINETCNYPKSYGEPCSDNAECSSEICEMGLCSVNMCDEYDEGDDF